METIIRIFLKTVYCKKFPNNNDTKIFNTYLDRWGEARLELGGMELLQDFQKNAATFPKISYNH